MKEVWKEFDFWLELKYFQKMCLKYPNVNKITSFELWAWNERNPQVINYILKHFLPTKCYLKSWNHDKKNKRKRTTSWLLLTQVRLFSLFIPPLMFCLNKNDKFMTIGSFFRLNPSSTLAHKNILLHMKYSWLQITALAKE